ncbi:hypothetical protein U1Q18_033161 [Sarracenia purpurea var. burkii]
MQRFPVTWLRISRWNPGATRREFNWSRTQERRWPFRIPAGKTPTKISSPDVRRFSPTKRTGPGSLGISTIASRKTPVTVSFLYAHLGEDILLCVAVAPGRLRRLIGVEGVVSCLCHFFVVDDIASEVNVQRSQQTLLVSFAAQNPPFFFLGCSEN